MPLTFQYLANEVKKFSNHLDRPTIMILDKNLYLEYLTLVEKTLSEEERLESGWSARPCFADIKVFKSSDPSFEGILFGGY